eukprot:IDg3238t1
MMWHILLITTRYSSRQSSRADRRALSFSEEHSATPGAIAGACWASVGQTNEKAQRSAEPTGRSTEDVTKVCGLQSSGTVLDSSILQQDISSAKIFRRVARYGSKEVEGGGDHFHVGVKNTHRENVIQSPRS